MARTRDEEGWKNGDRWRRLLTDRPPPQTWKSVGLLVLTAVVVLVLGAVVASIFLLPAVLALFCLLRALATIVSARFWGTARPLDPSMSRRLRWWTSGDG